MSDDQTRNDTLSLALRLLAKELARRVRRHPQGHLLAGRGETVRLDIDLPSLPRDGWLARAKGHASGSLDQALQRLLAHRAVFRPGRVYCLRCRSAGCEHSAAARSPEVFAGYGPSGVPRYADLGQWLLERKDPRVDLLYRTPPGLVAHPTPGSELTAALLPAFRDLDSGYHIHGQVAAGWFRFPDAAGVPAAVALTFQVISSRPRRGRRRFGLNLLGSAPGGEPLETLYDRVGELPWAGPAAWAQGALQQVERWVARGAGPPEEALEQRLAGLLNGLARRLERLRRADQRRTVHARKRHGERTRPTWKAVADAAGAADEGFLFDTRRETLVVLGQRGRAHVFNPEGKLVTSVRYSPAAIERRKKTGLWRPATAEQIAELRRRLGERSEAARTEG